MPRPPPLHPGRRRLVRVVHSFATSTRLASVLANIDLTRNQTAAALAAEISRKTGLNVDLDALEALAGEGGIVSGATHRCCAPRAAAENTIALRSVRALDG